jgi:hypothetical protein
VDGDDSEDGFDHLKPAGLVHQVGFPRGKLSSDAIDQGWS